MESRHEASARRIRLEALTNTPWWLRPVNRTGTLAKQMRYHLLRRGQFANFGIVRDRLLSSTGPDAFDQLVAIHMGDVHGRSKMDRLLVSMLMRAGGAEAPLQTAEHD